MSVSRKLRQMPVLRWLQIIIGVIVVITSIPAVAVLFAVDVIPHKFLFVTVLIYLIIAGLAVWQLLRKTTAKWQSILFIVIGLILTVVNIYAYDGGRAIGFFTKNVQQPKVSYVEYAIIAKKDQPIKVSDATTVGLVKTDTLYEESTKVLKNETPAQQIGYDNMTLLTESLNVGDIELASIRKANLYMLQENYQEFYDSVTTLATYKVRDTQKSSSNVDVKKPFVLYISGVDTYGDIGEVSRSDVNMLAVVNPITRKILLVNTPRDYYVTLHGTTGPPDKLTHAGLYGVDMSRQTMADLYDIDIPFYLRLNFTSLVNIIDVVGDVNVYSDYAFKSFKQGNNTLNSKRALEFARERYSFTDGDRQRGRNQQKVIEALIAKLSEPKNIVRYNAILNSLQDSVQTNMSESEINQLIKAQLDDMKRWEVQSISVDGSGANMETYSMGKTRLYVMVPDQVSVDLAKKEISKYLTY